MQQSDSTAVVGLQRRAALGVRNTNLGGGPGGKDALLRKPLARNNNAALPAKKAIQPEPRKPLRAVRQSGATTSTAVDRPMTRRLSKALEEENAKLDASMTEAAAYSSKEIPNIDENDENPLMVVQYVNEIYSYLQQLEIDQHIRPDFLSNRGVTARMRAVLVDWLVQVQVRYSLLPETLQMGVALMDRYLQDVTVGKNDLQKVGVTALFIASKYEEIYPPEITDFVYITDDAFSTTEIRAQERQLLRQLQFNIGRPVPIHFLRRYSKAIDADSLDHLISKFFVELALLDYGLAQLRPSIVAAACAYLSARLVRTEGESEDWLRMLVHYSNYSYADLKPVVVQVVAVVLKYQKSSRTDAIRRKYASSKFNHVANNKCLEASRLQQILLSL